MTLDPITEELLKSWERAGDIYAIAAREVRAELEEEAAAHNEFELEKHFERMAEGFISKEASK